LENLESRVVPAGGGGSLRAHLADAARVARSGCDSLINDPLNVSWGATGPATAVGQSAGLQSTSGDISAFASFAPAAVPAPLPDATSQFFAQIVTVTSPDPSASEDPTFPPGTPETQDTAFFRITRTAANNAGFDAGDGEILHPLALGFDANPLTVFFMLSGTAQNGVDYFTIPGMATIPAGQDFVDVTVIPLSREAQPSTPDVTVTLTLLQNESYFVGEPGNAVAVIFQSAHFGNGGGTTPPMIPPPVQPPPPPPKQPAPQPKQNSGPAESIALGNGSTLQGFFIPPPETLPIVVAGLPLYPALRDLPAGLLPPTRNDDIALVGGTNAVGQISGKIFDDFNGTGMSDHFKPGLPGVTVFLDLNNNGIVDFGEPTTTSNANGEYSFTGLQAGTYIVRQAMPGNILQTLPANEAPYEVTLERMVDAAATDRNFGVQFLSSRGRAIGTSPRKILPPSGKPKEATPSPGGGGADDPDDDQD
jgi:hypothetical protein